MKEETVAKVNFKKNICISEYEKIIEEQFIFDQKKAEACLEIGKNLKSIDDDYFCSGHLSSFEVPELFLDSNAEQSIPPKTREICKLIASIGSIEEYTWLGYDFIVILLKNIKNEYLRNMDLLFDDLRLNKNEKTYKTALMAKNLSYYYNTFRKVKKIRSDALFQKVKACIDKGIDLFDNEMFSKWSTSKKINSCLETLSTSQSLAINDGQKKSKKKISNNIERKMIELCLAIYEGLDENPEALKTISFITHDESIAALFKLSRANQEHYSNEFEDLDENVILNRHENLNDYM